MNDIEKTPEYFSWIGELKKRYRATQIKAAGLVKDKELLKKIGWMAGRIASVVSVCAAMPKVYNKKALAAWAKAYRKCFEI